jgi:hypothetical protein
LTPAWILLSEVDMSGMLMGGAAAVLGFTCMIPIAPPGLLADCSNIDSW